MILKTYAGVFAKAKVHGNFPLPNGPKIIAVNHTLASDALHIPLVVEDQTSFLLQASLFQLPWVGPLLKLDGHIPVRQDGTRPGEVLHSACRALAEGKTLVIFPEGRLVRPGERVRARSGVMRIALQSGVPIIPLGIYTAPENILEFTMHWLGQKRTGLWQISGRCHLNFGTPWKPSPAWNASTSLQEQTDELMNDIYALVAEMQKELRCVSPTSLNPILR